MESLPLSYEHKVINVINPKPKSNDERPYLRLANLVKDKRLEKELSQLVDEAQYEPLKDSNRWASTGIYRVHKMVDTLKQLRSAIQEKVIGSEARENPDLKEELEAMDDATWGVIHMATNEDAFQEIVAEIENDDLSSADDENTADSDPFAYLTEEATNNDSNSTGTGSSAESSENNSFKPYSPVDELIEDNDKETKKTNPDSDDYGLGNFSV